MFAKCEFENSDDGKIEIELGIFLEEFLREVNDIIRALRIVFGEVFML